MFNQPSSMPPSTPPSIAPAGSAKLTNRPASNSGLIKTIIIILLSLLLVGALLLAYYFNSEYRTAKSDVESQVAAGVLDREKEITDKLEAEYVAKEKLPYSTFTGPSDYGSLTFKFPKTWSVYIGKDASATGGDFEAYLHPVEVPPVSSTTINALRVSIRTETVETATGRYKSLVQSGKLAASAVSINGTDATRYDGQLLNNLVGSLIIFKMRDKTILIQTDAEIYREDFNQIIETISFNQ